MDDVLEEFLKLVKDRGLGLYPAQEEAILEVFAGKNVILNTPTGSGKSLVAEALHLDALRGGRRSYYTSPIKALVNEKFFTLCREFGPNQVGMVTGDGAVNAQAPIVCCTAEILMNEALRLGKAVSVRDVVMDEFHYYADRERGVAWQVPLLTLSDTRFLLMSATLGDTAPFEKALSHLNGRETVVVRSSTRPVPLDFQYSERPLHLAVSRLIEGGRAPIYLVNFTQRECAEEAQNFMSVELCSKDEKRQIAAALEGFRFSSPYGKEIQKFLKHGMGIHHASLLPKYRSLVEKLAQRGLLKIIFGTDTLGVGVNVPIRSVLLTKLCKYDGEKTVMLSVRDFQQICGRAGRKGFDELGTVVIQAPAHVIENLRNEEKAASDPKKAKKLVKQKPPEKGYLPWTKETFEKLVNGQPEPLISRFKVTHSMLLQVLSRTDGTGCDTMRDLIRDCHESDHVKKQLRKTAFQLFRSLIERRIVELDPLRVNVDLQEDFSLNHALSLYLVDTVNLLDPVSETYALDVLTLVESILENPELILRKQLDRIKTEKMQEMKEAGVEFDERIEELEKLEYPKPNREFIYSTFNAFAAAHPWVGEANIRPKSIAREMIENFHSFEEYIREYDLHRVEGLLLRYISDVYKALVQNVPGYTKNDDLYEISIYIGSMIRQIDSSLLEEWERMRDPSRVTATPHPGTEPERAPAWDPRALKIQVRNETFRLVKALAARDWDLAGVLSGWKAGELEDKVKEYLAQDHTRISTDPKARGREHFHLDASEKGEIWHVRQILVDPDGHNDWSLELETDLTLSREAGHPVLRLLAFGPV